MRGEAGDITLDREVGGESDLNDKGSGTPHRGEDPAGSSSSAQ